jgi:microsomal dipeptidase-like Zn-dependent dipeptidase
MNRYFDLHFHPALKPYLSNYHPDRRKNCWEVISSPLSIVRSQGSLDQAKEGRVGLAVVSFISIERPMTSSFLVDHVAHLFTVLDAKALDFSTYGDSLDRFQGEIEHLKKSQQLDPANGQSFKILNSIKEYDEHKLNLIFSIEGGHNLESCNGTLLDNFRSLKQSEHRFLYLTLTHMTQFPLATHAYSMKLIKSNDHFKPAGFGLTDLGKQIIDMAYDESIGPRILIDIKHLSLVSRYQFYQYRREKGYQNIPILATHMGVTGISRDPRAMVKYWNKEKPPVRRDDYVEINYDRPEGIGKGLFRKTHFNPWSINLYDEDIVEILDSGGLIGMNMDQRILGADKVQGEFFSADELNYILSGYKDPGHKEEIRQGELSDEEEADRDLNETKHLRHLCNNILHIVKVGGPRAWKKICLGSDFDGLINPINYCTNLTEFPKLEAGLADMLPQMMEEDTAYDYDQSNIEQKIRNIMYDNAVDFLNNYFR